MPARPRPVRLLLVAAVAVGLTTGLTLATVPADAAVKPKAYANCDALHRDYPHGVARKGGKDKTKSKSSKPVTNFVVNDAVYKLNTKRDADHDGVACEKH